MAAALPFASSLLEKGKETLARVKDELVDDPLAWLVKILRIVGSVFLIVGFVLGTAGYYLKAAATTAANNEVGILGNIGQIFGNLKAPSFTPAAGGTAPLSFSLQGIQNFFGDVWQDVQGAGSDVAQAGGVMGTLAEDVGIALTDVAKAILAFVQHFPDLLWNGLVWGVGGALADVVNWLFPYLILIGAILVGISFAIWGIRAAWRGILKAGWDEAWGEKQAELRGKVSGFFRKILHVKPTSQSYEDLRHEQGSGWGTAGMRGPPSEGIPRLSLSQSSWSLGPSGDLAKPGRPSGGSDLGIPEGGREPGVSETSTGEGTVGHDSGRPSGGDSLPEQRRSAVSDGRGEAGGIDPGSAERAIEDVGKAPPAHPEPSEGIQVASSSEARAAPEDLPLQEPPRRKELEKVLGDGYVEAKDRMRAALRTGASA
jgi:hypothetical protein